MDIFVLGVGEAGDPDFSNSSVAVTADGFRLLIDCGHSVPPSLWRALPDPDAVDAVYFTHHHPDHCFGLVPVLIRWTDDGRRKPLEIVTTAEGRRQLTRLFEAGGIDPERARRFPLVWRETPGEGTEGRIGPFAVRSAPTLHAVPNHAIRLEAGGRSFAYSGDGRPTREAEDLYRGADLLFQECFTLQADPTQPFHAAHEALAGWPERLGIGAVRLYHVRRDQREALAAACSGDGRMGLALPGERIRLG